MITPGQGPSPAGVTRCAGQTPSLVLISIWRSVIAASPCFPAPLRAGVAKANGRRWTPSEHRRLQTLPLQPDQLKFGRSIGDRSVGGATGEAPAVGGAAEAVVVQAEMLEQRRVVFVAVIMLPLA